MDSKLMILRLPEVKNICGLGRSSIYSMMGKNSFPKSIRLGKRARGWVSSEIYAWLEDRMQERAMVNNSE